MTLENKVGSFQQLGSSAKRAGSAIVFYSALAMSAVSCGREPSECCIDLDCYGRSVSDSCHEPACTDSPVYNDVDHCVTDKKGAERCCSCIERYSPGPGCGDNEL